MKQLTILLTGFCLLSFLSACNNKQKVSLIIQHATIYTADSSFSEVQAMAINNGKIIATGTDEEIMKKYSSDSTTDATGKTVFPGFIDAHCHFTGYATDMWKCNLVGTTSLDEIVNKIKAYSINAPREWIYGRGWDQNKWTVCSQTDQYF